MTHWPQIAIAAFYIIDLGASLVTCGSSCSAVPFALTAVEVGATVGLLHEGGFWTVFGWSP